MLSGFRSRLFLGGRDAHLDVKASLAGAASTANASGRITAREFDEQMNFCSRQGNGGYANVVLGRDELLARRGCAGFDELRAEIADILGSDPPTVTDERDTKPLRLGTRGLR